MTANSGIKRRHAWSASSNLKLGDSNFKTLLQADFDTPGLYTAQFTYKPPLATPNEGFSYTFQILAEVSWSVQGNTARRLISVTNGTAISGVGQAVNIRAYDFSPVLDVGGGPTDPNDLLYLLSINVVQGARVTSNSAPILAVDPWDEPPSLGAPQTAQPPLPGSIWKGCEIRRQVGVGAFPLNIQRGNVPTEAGINSVYFTFGENDQVGLTGPDDLEVVFYQGFESGSGLVEIQRMGLAAFNKWLPIFPGWTRFEVRNNTPDPVEVGITFGVEG